MSRWWPDRATLWLAPANGGDALACAAQALDRLALRPHTRLTCVLGGPLVRHRIVPWSDALASPAQRQVLATSCFLDAYGDMARAWTVREHGAGPAQRYGAATLACAIDTAVLDGLTTLARERRLRLASVQPSLVHAHNRVRRQLAGDMFWFVWEEGPLTTFVLWSRGEPLHLKALPSSPALLASALDREWFLAAAEGERCAVYLARTRGGAGGIAQDITALAGWQVVALPTIETDAGIAPDLRHAELRAA